MEHIGTVLQSLFCFADWTQFITEPNFIGKIVQALYNWIGNYGWTVVVFTVFLKVATLPLEIWQKFVTKKSSLKMKALQPMIEKIDKQYGHDQARANQEKSKLYKKQGYSALASCLPVLVTMGVFIFMFSGLNSYSNYINLSNYAGLDAAYGAAYEQTEAAALADGKTAQQAAADALIAGKNAAGLYYSENIQESFLWVKNVWRPDTWEKSMATANQFKKGGIGTKAIPAEAPFDPVRYQTIYEGVLETNHGYFSSTNSDGTLARNAKGDVKAGWNGLLILPLLALGLTFLTSWQTAKQQKAGSGSGSATTQEAQAKMMMWMMPIMMGGFALFYTAAFAIYLVASSLISLGLSLATNGLINKMVEKSLSKNKPQKASYMR